MHHHSNPRTLLSPAMHKVLDSMARTGHVPLHALNPQQARLAYQAGAGVLEILAHKLARVDDLVIVARDGHPIPVRLYSASREPLPVLLYFHGGGFTVGSIDTHDALCRSLSQLAHCAVISVDYRLAPEYKFPVAHQDAWDCLQWVAHNGSQMGLDSSRLAVGGDSAGGTLATVCAVLARDAKLALCLQLLFYPGCTAHQDTPSHLTFAKGFLLEQEHINYFFNQYLNHPSERDDWRFAPLNTPELEGVAPVWMGLAECDALVDEGVLYADRLRLAGVAVDLEIYRGVVHEFVKMGRAIPQALLAHQDAARALRKAFELPAHPLKASP